MTIEAPSVPTRSNLQARTDTENGLFGRSHPEYVRARKALDAAQFPRVGDGWKVSPIDGVEGALLVRPGAPKPRGARAYVVAHNNEVLPVFFNLDDFVNTSRNPYGRAERDASGAANKEILREKVDAYTQGQITLKQCYLSMHTEVAKADRRRPHLERTELGNADLTSAHELAYAFGRGLECQLPSTD